MATMPLTFSPPRLLLHRRRRHLQAKPQRHSTASFPLLPRLGAGAARLYCAPDGSGSEVSAPPPPPPTAEQQEQAPQEEEAFTLLAANRSDFNEVIMVVDSPSSRYLLLDPNRMYGLILPTRFIRRKLGLVWFVTSSSVFGCLVQGMFTAFSPRTASGPTRIGYVRTYG